MNKHLHKYLDTKLQLLSGSQSKRSCINTLIKKIRKSSGFEPTAKEIYWNTSVDITST